MAFDITLKLAHLVLTTKSVHEIFGLDKLAIDDVFQNILFVRFHGLYQVLLDVECFHNHFFLYLTINEDRHKLSVEPLHIRVVL